MSDPNDLRSVDTEDLYGEIRRRRLPAFELREALNLFEPPRPIPPDPAERQFRLRNQALMILAGLTCVLLLIIGFLAVTSKLIPDLISGLAGTGLGAIAGILAGGGGGGGGTA
jgi:hypothetical protein